MPVPNSIQYSDLDLSFAAHPVTKNLSIVKNERAVKQALKSIVLTNRYERFYKPLLGSSIRQKLFENFGPNISYEIKEDIRVAIRNYEPRVEILEVKVDETPDINSLEVTITFLIRNLTDAVTTTISVERIR
jgi:hypothetical protein